MDEFPNDENGAVLRLMKDNGDNLKMARTMNFSVVFEEKVSAEEFVDVMTSKGFSTTLHDPLNGMHDVSVDVFMLPEHSRISAFEGMLADEAGPLGGRNDGWGSLSQG